MIIIYEIAIDGDVITIVVYFLIEWFVVYKKISAKLYGSFK